MTSQVAENPPLSLRESQGGRAVLETFSVLLSLPKYELVEALLTVFQ